MARPSLQLDFIRPAGDRRGLGFLLLVAGLLAAGAAFLDYDATRAEHTRWADKLADTQRLARRTLPNFAPAEAPSRESAQALQAANLVLDQLTLPWDGLFADVERAVTPDIALLAVQPDPKNRALNLGGEARDLNGLLTFLARLESTPGLRDVHLTQHEVRVNDPHRPIAFTAQARWTSVR
ncbi:MAG: PilN domain-containing protein [Burkholderiales bacterium]|nr:PilN domain-containing protein [Burkholderiales bacterium]